MTDWGGTELLSNRFVACGIRVVFGAYVAWVARRFYANPLAYFRRWMPQLPDLPWMRSLVRFWAAFCIWGGCFIVATAVATQIFEMHGWVPGVLLVLLAVAAAFLLLPAKAENPPPEYPGENSVSRWK